MRLAWKTRMELRQVVAQRAVQQVVALQVVQQAVALQVEPPEERQGAQPVTLQVEPRGRRVTF